MTTPKDDAAPPAKGFLYRLYLNSLLHIPRLRSPCHSEERLRAELAKLDGEPPQQE